MIGPISAQLEGINKILRNSNAHVGYRVRDEIVFYLINNMNAGLLKEEAFDNCVMQKILDGGNVTYPKSAAKIKFMVQRFEEDGFTSYWL